VIAAMLLSDWSAKPAPGALGCGCAGRTTSPLYWLCASYSPPVGECSAPNRRRRFPIVDNPLAYAGFWTAKLTALKVICLDLWLMIFPVHLSCDRSYNQISLAGWSDPAAWAAILIVGGLLAVCILRRRKDPMMFWCAGFAPSPCSPVSNLAVTIGSVMAERFPLPSFRRFRSRDYRAGLPLQVAASRAGCTGTFDRALCRAHLPPQSGLDKRSDTRVA